MDFGQILGTFSEAEAEKNQEKIVLKNTRFFYIDFSAFFFAIFSDFAWILGGARPSKNWKKSETIDFLTRSVLKEGSGRVLGRFWDGFGTVLKGFGMDFNGIWGRFLKLFERIWKDKQ